jgi:hypothetical protein
MAFVGEPWQYLFAGQRRQGFNHKLYDAYLLV